MPKPERTITTVFGQKAADKLAAFAIDILCEPPADITTYSTRVPANVVREGRKILEDVGIDWRKLKGTADSAQYQREREYGNPE